jgi:hypothetical protein
VTIRSVYHSDAHQIETGFLIWPDHLYGSKAAGGIALFAQTATARYAGPAVIVSYRPEAEVPSTNNIMESR